MNNAFFQIAEMSFIDASPPLVSRIKLFLPLCRATLQIELPRYNAIYRLFRYANFTPQSRTIGIFDKCKILLLRHLRA